MELTL
jgi:hypothetical protein